MTSSNALLFDPDPYSDLSNPDSVSPVRSGAGAPALTTVSERKIQPRTSQPQSDASRHLALALSGAVLVALGVKFLARDTENDTLKRSQSHHDLSFWLSHSGKLRSLIIAETANTVARNLGGPLGSAAGLGITEGLKFLPSAIRARGRINADLVQPARGISTAWAKRYAKHLGEGLGNTSADGMLVSMASVQRAGMAEDLAWRVLYGAAGLSKNDSMSVVEVAKARLLANAKSRRPIGPKDLAQDTAKLLLSRRAKTIAANEYVVAHNFGVQILLMQAVAKGYLPPDTKRVWVTAVDERVCPVCAPMDSVAAKLDEPFHIRAHHGLLHRDVNLWVPPAHTNCRCTIVASNTIEHGITTRTARFSRNNPTEAAWPIPAKFNQDRARLRSSMLDVVHQGESPPWMRV